MNKSNFINHKVSFSKDTDLASTREEVVELLIEARDKSAKGNYNDSLVILEHCATLTPDFDQVYLAIAEVYRQKGQNKMALLNLNRAIELVPDNAEAYIMRGEVFRLLRQYEPSLKNFNQAIELTPNNPTALGRRGTLFRNTKEFTKSLKDYNRAISLDPFNSWLYGNRAETYRELKEYRKAVNDYNHVLVLNPKLNWVYERRSYPYLWLGELELAHSDLELSWNLNPTNFMVGWMRVWTAMCQTPFPFTAEIKEKLTRLVEQDPLHYIAYLCRAIIFWTQEDLNGSYKELETACNLLPEEPDAYFWKGLLAAGLKRDAEALILIEKALDLGMPPVLLNPLRWLEQVNPIFYKKHGTILLGKVLHEDGDSAGSTVNPLPDTHGKNIPDDIIEPQAETQVQPWHVYSSLDETAQFPQIQLSADETIKLDKPPETFPVESLSEPPILESNETEVAEATQPFKVAPFNARTVEKPEQDKPHIVKMVEQPSKPDEIVEVEQPVNAQEGSGVKPPVIFPEERVNPTAAADGENEKLEISQANFISIPQESSTQEIADKIPAPVSTGLSNQSDTFGVIPEKQTGFVASAEKQPEIKEIKPAYLENNNIIYPAKKSRLLLSAIIVGAGLFITGLLISILLLNGNANKAATNNQVAVAITITPGVEVSSGKATAPALPASVPAISPTSLNAAPSSLAAPTPTGVSQAMPTAFATPGLTTTATSSLSVSPNALNSTNAVPTTITTTPTATPITAIPTPTQVPLTPLNTQPLNGHTGLLTTASWTKDGRYYLTASEDKTIKVWDAATNQLIRTLDDKTRPNTEAVLTARWSSDSQFIISGSADKYVRLYMVLPKQNNSKLAVGSVLIDATDKVVPQAVAMAPDNSLVLYPGPNVVHSWNASTDDQGPDFSLDSPGAVVTALVFSGDSKYLTIGLSTGTVQLWDVKAKKRAFTIPADKAAAGPVKIMEWLPGEKQLLVGYQEGLSVYAVNLSGGAVSPSLVSALPLNIKVNTLAISPDAKRLAVGSQTGQVEVWSLENKKLINQFSISSQQPVPVVGLHWGQTDQGQEISVVGGGANPFIANYRIPAD